MPRHAELVLCHTQHPSCTQTCPAVTELPPDLCTALTLQHPHLPPQHPAPLYGAAALRHTRTAAGCQAVCRCWDKPSTATCCRSRSATSTAAEHCVLFHNHRTVKAGKAPSVPSPLPTPQCHIPAALNTSMDGDCPPLGSCASAWPLSGADIALIANLTLPVQCAAITSHPIAATWGLCRPPLAHLPSGRYSHGTPSGAEQQSSLW